MECKSTFDVADSRGATVDETTHRMEPNKMLLAGFVCLLAYGGLAMVRTFVMFDTVGYRNTKSWYASRTIIITKVFLTRYCTESNVETCYIIFCMTLCH